MKKTLLAMATIASLGMISTAQAATAPNEVTFIGAVSATTCELVPEVNGTIMNLIDLGVATPGNPATPVNFKFKAKTPADCGTTETITMQWSGPAIGANGLEMTSGTAIGTVVALEAKPASGPVNITNTSDSADFTNTDLLAGLDYTATLNGGTAGSFRTAAAYTVSYR